jgi:hypothetical protein
MQNITERFGAYDVPIHLALFKKSHKMLEKEDAIRKCFHEI